MVFESLLNPILNPLLESVGYFWTLLILSLVITLIITIIYKFTTNQSLMKDLKGELKELQKQMKELKSSPDKAMVVQKKMMDTNGKYMMHSFKPMIFTFLPIILFFGWMGAHLAYYPIIPGEEFSVGMEFSEGVSGDVRLILPDGIETVNGLEPTIKAEQATWFLKGEEGEYLLSYEFGDDVYSNEVLISNERTFKPPLKKVNKGGIKTIMTNLEPVLLLNVGFHTFGWLGTYIIFSIIFSSLIRKLMKVY